MQVFNCIKNFYKNDKIIEKTLGIDKKSGIVKDKCLCYTCNIFCYAKESKFRQRSRKIKTARIYARHIKI